MSTQLKEAPPTTETAVASPPRRIRGWQIVAVVLVLALLVVVALQMRRSGPLAAAQVGAGEPAPTFELTGFDGQSYSLAAYRGQVVVVNFWASWCVPCAQEAAELESLWRHYQGQPFVMIGVDWVDTETEARDYLRRFDITYPNGPDLGTRISQAYRIRGAPETFIVDKTGILRGVIIGPTTQAKLQAIIDPLLAQ